MLPTLTLSSILGILRRPGRLRTVQESEPWCTFRSRDSLAKYYTIMQLFPKDVVICMEPPFSNVQHALLTSIKYIFRYALPAWEALIGYFDKSADDRKDILDPRLHVTCSWTTNTSLDHESNFGRSAVYLNLTFILGVRSINGRVCEISGRKSSRNEILEVGQGLKSR
jgi:hypothetical protein